MTTSLCYLCLERFVISTDHNWLVEQFEAHQNHWQAVAFRMLGSWSEADDAVQESGMRLSRSDTSVVG